MYKPAANGSIYAGLRHGGPAARRRQLRASRVPTPPRARLRAQPRPAGGTNTEIGTKWDVLDERLALTAAVYRTDGQERAGASDP